MSLCIHPVGLAADANMYGIPCAQSLYGVEVINEVLDPEPGGPIHEDNEGQEIGVVFDDAEICSRCFQRVEDCTGEAFSGGGE